MFNVIRIPTKYGRTINRFSDYEKAELLRSLISIGAGNPVTIKDDIVWDTISLIYGDWMRMESKNWVKPEKPLIQYSSELVVQGSAGKSPPIVHDNIIQDNIIQDKKKSEIKIYDDSSFEYKICKYFIEKHLELKTPSFLYLYKENWEQKLIQKWSDEIRKMKEIDKYTEEQIKYIIKYLFENDFWREQILSMEKFRKKNKEKIPYFVVLIDEAKKGLHPKIKRKVW